ncbi:unnamed protein product [Fraxinus pennsylvanica]|uniref:Uncharacterized protein n=1 Tax=Fraxinus pennsylvanica TaxID=56036 RepID=A0AAD1ZKF8_9LAMI|nr:unnamed protein product [Fraxinus pennsylvanica]
MERRNCGNTHYFQAIRGGLVLKVHNIDSRGKPPLSFRTLKDVYESEDAKRLGRPSTSDKDILSAGSVFNYDQVISETLCFPLVERTLKEVKLAFDEFVLCGDDDDIDWDLDDNTTLKQLRERSKTITLKEVKLEFDEYVPRGNDDDIHSDLDHNSTLKQLMERSKTKKRKLGSSTGVDPEQADANGKRTEDESDIDEPLIIWKSKLAKNSKVKRKCTNKNVVTSLEASSSIKSEQNQLSEGSMQVDSKLPPVIRVKAEVPEPELQGCQTPTCFADDSSTDLNEESKIGDIASNGISMECENREALFFAEECQNCVTNEVSYDHLEHVKPISMLLPSNGRTVKVEYQEMDCHEFLVSPPSIIETEKDNLRVLSSSSPAKIHGSYVRCTKSSSKMEEISEQTRGDSSGQVPKPAVDNNIGCTEPCNEVNFYTSVDNTKEDLLYEKNGSLTSPDKSCISSVDASISLEINDNSAPLKNTMADGESLKFTFDAVARNGLNSGDQLEDELSKSKERQTPASPGTYKERKPSLDYQGCDIANTLPILDLYQPPQRLLSTRKAISPYSQEQLCLNMNSVELHDEVDQCECKGKLWIEKQNENVLSGRSDIEHSKITESIGEPVVRSQRKVFINPRQILKKSQNFKASLPKGNLEGPRFSRTLPNFSTGCSTKGCSESAIAFSQRQMHDIESLAMKLMNELKFVKDIVEEKLLFEAYRNTSLKNDAEEVKAAIDNSTKVEETAKKWLSMMNRDCNRFCKIMKLSQNSVTAPENVVKRERKKIVFADEAGGNLCHVKYFEDGITSPVSEVLQASDAELQQG